MLMSPVQENGMGEYMTFCITHLNEGWKLGITLMDNAPQFLHELTYYQ